MRITRTSRPNRWQGLLAVEWHFSQWNPVIQLRAPVVERTVAVKKPLLPAGFILHPARRKKESKLMNKSLSAMRYHRAAFTLIELLVVIAIIAILAAMILAALAGAHTAALKVKAKSEIADIVNAINAYNTDYGRFPVTAAEQQAAGTNDFTTGLVMPSVSGAPGPSFDNNSNVVAILMDLQAYPNGSPTCNTNHIKNPKQVKYLNAKVSGYDPTKPGAPYAGVDNTGVYRDPWGNPYIITMDLSYDNQCSDLLYSQAAVSATVTGSATGFNGLSNTNATGNPNNYLFQGTAMVWSLGPDGKYDQNTPANTGVNKDNILSWQ